MISDKGRQHGREVELQLDEESFSDFRINFRVTKDLGAEPNSANIEIYGLGRKSTAKVLNRTRDLRVRLLAGYNVPRLIFEGNPVRNGVEFETDSPERIIKIEANDGLHQYQSARVNFSVEEDTTYDQLVNKIARDAGFSTASIGNIPQGSRKVTVGRVVEGRARDHLDYVAEALGCDWSIQDGNFQFLHKDDIGKDRGYRFSPELGNIIESPKPKDGGNVEVTVLLHHIDPGDRFEIRGVEVDEFNGVYKAESVVYNGDSGFENAFYSNIEARPLPT